MMDIENRLIIIMMMMILKILGIVEVLKRLDGVV